jgi:uncharacterized protein
MTEEQLAKIRAFALGMAEPSGSHGPDHTERVVRLCRFIGGREHADMDILIPAALLHDVARPVEKADGIPHEIRGAEIAEEFLATIGYNPELIPPIAGAIRTHRYRSDRTPATIEAMVLSDADKLDAMGAIGIARTFMRAAEHGGGISDAIGHFHDKLLLLHERMYTTTGRRMAEKRYDVLVRFLKTLSEETGADDDTGPV